MADFLGFSVEEGGREEEERYEGNRFISLLGKSNLFFYYLLFPPTPMPIFDPLTKVT